MAKVLSCNAGEGAQKVALSYHCLTNPFVLRDHCNDS